MQRYDYSKLLGRMRERGFTQSSLAKHVGVSECTLNLSLNNNRDFKQEEMLNACKALGIPIREIPVYFFAHKL